MTHRRQARVDGVLRAGALAGLLLFLLIQVFPFIREFAKEPFQVLTRGEIRQRAEALAAERFGVDPGRIVSLDVTYLTDSPTVGYFSKHELLDEYEKAWYAEFPTDTYRADLLLDDGSRLLLSFHMESGNLVAWEHAAAERTDDFPASVRPEDALSWAAKWGIRPGEWTPAFSSGGQAKSELVFRHRGSPVGEAGLLLAVRPPAPGDAEGDFFGGKIAYHYELPEAFAAEVQRQEELAERWATFGSFLPQSVMLLLAIVFAAVYGKYSSFRRGLFLASFAFLAYSIVIANMWPGFGAELLADGLPVDDLVIFFTVFVSILVALGVAVMTYFGAVAGDGLWNRMEPGSRLWPRWREADYGEHVYDAMKRGYLVAFILLGLQSCIFLVLEKGIGSFVTTDVTHSTYNMFYPWLFPLLGWWAAVTEEIQARFFGIGIMRLWLIGLAAFLLRGAPSARTAAVLTWLAMIPPNLVWAFGHVGYSIYPVYSRLIELVLLGFVIGGFMLRYGLMTVIFAHAALDGILIGLQLLTDGMPGDEWAAVISMASPALVGWAIFRLHRRRLRRKAGSAFA
ncbi:MAG TPA: hypothetical protein VIL22_03800 [Paenibacillaceae bacterium]